MAYLVTFEDGSSGYLQHYGVKGMKWGVWNESTRNRYSKSVYPKGVIPKGTVVSRWSRQSEFKDYTHDPLSGGVKYVSTNVNDHEKWKKHFDMDTQYGEPPVSSETFYKTMNDIKVAKAAEAGKVYVEKVLPSLSENAMKDASYFMKTSIAGKSGISDRNTAVKDAVNPGKVGKVQAENAASLLAANSVRFNEVPFNGHDEASKKLIAELKKKGYSAMQDTFGWNVSADPIIIFDPKDNLSVVRESKIIADNKKFKRAS